MKTNTFTSKLWSILMLAVMALVITASLGTSVIQVYASNDKVSLSDLIDSTSTNNTTMSDATTPSSTNSDNILDDISAGFDYSGADNEIVKNVGGQINYYAGVVIQILAYIITAGLTLSKLLDIMYIAIPLTRKWLANGYMGNAGAAGTPNGMAPGAMGGMGGGMMGPGMGGMGMGRYNMGGMNAMNGMAGGMGPMADSRMAAQNQPATGRPQFVSNAALNAVATESVLGTDGRGQNAFKLYFRDMLISIVLTGVLIVLCITGVVAKLGFMLGNFVGDILRDIQF